jgi:hypothetical protein
VEETLSPSLVAELRQRVQSRDLMSEEDTSARLGKASPATYVVNRDEVGKAVAATIHLTHVQ